METKWIDEVRLINELSEIIDECIDNNLFLYNKFKDKRKNCKEENVRNALGKIWQYIVEHYTGIAYASRKENIKNHLFAGKEIEAKSAKKFLNAIKSDYKLLKALIDKVEYSKVNLLGTYGRKIRILEMLERDIDISEFIKDNADVNLLELMKYYLVMKYLRNNINHANEDESNEDEKVLIKYFEAKGIDATISFDSVHHTISEGLRLTNPQLFK